MKIKKLLLSVLCAVLSVGAWAAPADYLSGWTEVTSLPTNNAELSKYYYVFVEGDMMVGQDKATKPDGQENQLTAVYMTPADPKTNNKLVWTLDYNSTWEYGIRSLAHQGHYMQSRENAAYRLQAAWETNQSQWTHMVFAYSEGTWTIQNKGFLKDTTKDYGTNYWGSWGQGSDRYTNGYCLAGNKSGDFIGKFKIYSLPRCLYTAMTPGKDMTDCISNNSFELDWAGWTNTSMSIQNNTSFGKTGSKYAEKWEPNGTFGVERTISNLPEGLYKITVHTKARSVSSAYLYANDNQKQITIADNEFDVEVYEKLNSAGSIKIGAKAVGTGVGASWFCLDNFTLTYVGADFPEVETVSGLLYNKELETAQNTAKTAYEENKTVANYDALVAAVAAAKAEKDYEDAQVARTTAALTNGTIATDVIDGWRCTNAQAFHVNTWSTEGATDGSDMTTPFIENWTGAGGLLGNGEVSYLMVGLTPGATYSFSALGRAIIEKKNETLHGITMFANEAEVDLTTQGTANYDGNNSLVYGTFTLTGTVNSDGVLSIGFKINGTNCNWLSFKNVKFGELPTEAEKTAFTTAYDLVKNNVFGFEEGEYAPYTNIEAYKAIVTSKAVDVEHAMKAEIVNATNALTNAVWTINEGEVNAVYNGNFDKSEADGAPAGWITGNSTTMGESGHARVLGYTETGNKKNFDIFGTQFGQTGETRYAFYARLDRSNAQRDTKFTYGTVEGYTMPLKAGVYSIKLKSGGWGQGNKSFKVSLTSDNGTEIATQQINNIPLISDGNGNAVQFYFKAVLSEAGNYRLVITNGNTSEDNAQCVSNIEIFRVPEEEIEGRIVTADYNLGTFISEIDRTIPSGLKVYSCAAVEDNVLTLVEETSIKANTPYILENTTNSDVTIDAVNGQSLKVEDSYTKGLLTGVYNEIDAPNGSYILQNHDGAIAFYHVNTDNVHPKVPAYRCYLTVSSNARILYIEEEETAVSTLEELVAGKAEIYGINGVKTNSLQKGVNILKLSNGTTQKVIVK